VGVSSVGRMSSTWDVEAGPVVDLLTAEPVAALDEAATLDALADNQRARNLADFRDTTRRDPSSQTRST
jgi:hypothetical protein